MTAPPSIEFGQSWAIRDGHTSTGCRYVTVMNVDTDSALAEVRANYPPCMHFAVPLGEFTRFTYCGMRGPGRQPPLSESDNDVLSRHTLLNPDVVLITSDGKHVCYLGGSATPSLTEFEEAMVAPNPCHDWRVEFVGTVDACLYQRQGSEWRLIWRGYGYPP